MQPHVVPDYVETVMWLRRLRILLDVPRNRMLQDGPRPRREGEMSSRVGDLLRKIQELEDELEAEIAKRRAEVASNGLFAYVREVAARTEQYWCPIKHARRLRGSQARYRDFFEYGDAVSYKGGLSDVRASLAEAKELPLAPRGTAAE
jgi:hypothetical protein